MNSNRITIVGMRYNINNWSGVFNEVVKLEDLVELRKEPDNMYDKNAIACYKDDVKIGYLESRLNTIVDEGTYEITGIGYYQLYAVPIETEEQEESNNDDEDFFNEDEEDEFIDDLANGRFL